MTPSALPPVCILAGGLGTRLGELARRAQAADRGRRAGRSSAPARAAAPPRRRARRALRRLSRRADSSRSGTARRFGLDVRYVFDAPELVGTAGAVRGALPLLGDALPRPLRRHLPAHRLRRRRRRSPRAARRADDGAAQRGRWDPATPVSTATRVVATTSRPDAGREWIDYGLGGLPRRRRSRARRRRPRRRLRRDSPRRGELAGYEATERFYEIGTPDALAETSAFLGVLELG